MAKHQGRLELTWTDKEKTLLSAGDGRYDYTFVDPTDYRVSEVRLLHKVEHIEAPTPEERPGDLPVPTTDNLLVTGDAMHVLDALAKIPEFAEKYLGKVKLVYIDPPFNTGQAFANYEDNIEHSIWLTMLRDRLRQIKPLLSDEGSVWVHLDDVEVHRCRAVMDEELGAENFITTVIWSKADSPRNSARHFSVDQDYILVYAKNAATWRPNRLPRTAASDADYRNLDNDPRGPWTQGDPFANKPYKLGLYEVTGPTGNTFGPPPGRYWRISQTKFEELDRDGRIYWRGGGAARPRIKRYLSEVADLVPRTVWDQVDVGSTGEGSREIRKLFPDIPVFATPKPERLLSRVIATATRPGDIVLDCFAGSGTTAAVAHKMGRRWVTSELLSETAETFTKPRLTKVVHGADQGGITKSTERVAADGLDLPEGVSPSEAQEFARVLGKIARTADTSLDKGTLKALRDAAKTREITTTVWHGGGGFTHLRVGPSMFVEFDDMILLADWATHGDLARAMCAQIGVPYQPDGIFSARRGRTRVVIVDGMVGTETVAAVLDRLDDGEAVEIWATQIADGAAAALRDARPGSRLDPIPEAVLDNYRRKSATRRPFGAGHVTNNEKGI